MSLDSPPYFYGMRKIVLFLCFALFLCSCQRAEHYSEVPYIEYKDLQKVDNGTGTDDQANLVVYFQDGDGDIGLSESDTTGVFAYDSAYYYNFFIDYYEKQNGEWVLVELPTPLHVRIPYLIEEESEAIEGDIKLLTYINN